MRTLFLIGFTVLICGAVNAGDFNSGKLSLLENSYSQNLDNCTKLSNKPLSPIKNKPNLDPTECRNTILYLYLHTMHSCSKQTKQDFESELKLSSQSNSDSTMQKRINNHLLMIKDEETMRLNAQESFLELPAEKQSELLNTEISRRPFNGIQAEEIYCHKMP